MYRGCADGRSQREYTTKAETSSHIVSLEDMMMTCAIDTKKICHRNWHPRSISTCRHEWRCKHDIRRDNLQADCKIQAETLQNMYGKINTVGQCYT